MYLAKYKIKGKFHYVIRESSPSSGGHYISRDLFSLGADPTRFIHYPGGKGYYFSPEIEDTLLQKGVHFHPNDIDDIFFDYLRPEIQRVITGFDRSYRTRPNQSFGATTTHASPIHLFDKRRFHYLRFGHSEQRFIHRVPDKIFRPLQLKSRDELENYFRSEEYKLQRQEKPTYVATIFQLAQFTPDPHRPTLPQMDAYFIDQLCDLNKNPHYLSGEPEPKGLYEHLVKYAIIYFDHLPGQPNLSHEFIRDFINRHRAHRPTAKTMAEIKVAEQLFGYDWKELKGMGRDALTRVYRKLALKHHPDQGGDAEIFRRLAKYYKALMERKPKGR